MARITKSLRERLKRAAPEEKIPVTVTADTGRNEVFLLRKSVIFRAARMIGVKELDYREGGA